MWRACICICIYIYIYVCVCAFLQCENWICLIICQKPLTSCLFSPPLLCMGHHLVHNHRFHILVKFAPKRWQILFDPHPTKGSFIRYSNIVVNNHVFVEIPFILKMMFLPFKCGFPCAANDVWIILELGTWVPSHGGFPIGKSNGTISEKPWFYWVKLSVFLNPHIHQLACYIPIIFPLYL